MNVVCLRDNVDDELFDGGRAVLEASQPIFGRFSAAVFVSASAKAGVAHAGDWACTRALAHTHTHAGLGRFSHGRTTRRLSEPVFFSDLLRLFPSNPINKSKAPTQPPTIQTWKENFILVYSFFPFDFFFFWLDSLFDFLLWFLDMSIDKETSFFHLFAR